LKPKPDGGKISSRDPFDGSRRKSVMLEPSSREALVGASSPKVEALILLNALPDEDLPEIIRIMRRMVGFEKADVHQGLTKASEPVE
jgi:hypothetical protein